MMEDASKHFQGLVTRLLQWLSNDMVDWRNQFYIDIARSSIVLPMIIDGLHGYS